MDSKERIRRILNREPSDRVGFWIGNPADETKAKYYKHFGIKEDPESELEKQNEKDSILLTKKAGRGDIEFAKKLNSDIIWVSPELDPSAWKHPDGKPMFDVYGGRPRKSLSQPGIFADCESIKGIEDFEWPDAQHLDLSNSIVRLNEASSNGMAVIGGMWMPFFHVMCDFFGMDNYFIKMYTNPEVVIAATEKVVDFYLAANKRCLDAMGGKLDAAFFGNDFGSQLDLLISPESFNQFILPYFRKLIEQIKSYNLKVVLHSCGSIRKVIPQLIDAGVDVLHPLQAKAAGMDADSLAREYKKDLIFFGGVDTQELLPFGTPQQVKEEVKRLKSKFGEGYIVSPSHEALLPNVSIENVIAMRDEALE